LRGKAVLRPLLGGLFSRLGALSLLGALCLLRLWDPVPVQFVRVKGFDLYQNIGPSRITERPVAIVDIDDASLAVLGQWPWPRTLLARLTERLAEYEVAAIGFDIVFAEPDRHSPKRYAEGMPELPSSVRDALQALPGNDEKFAAALAKTRSVLGIALLRAAPREGGSSVSSPPIAIRAPLDVDARSNLIAAPGLLGNIDILQRAAPGSGIITPFPEIDGVIRRVPAVYRIGEALYTALAIEMIRIATGGRTLVVRAGRDGIEAIIFSGAGMPSIVVPTDRRGRLWVHFSEHDPARYVSARHVLDGTVPRERLAGRLVLVGTSAVGLQDIRATPVTGSIPGVEIHAQLIENILFKDHIARPFFADAFEFFAAVLLSLMLILVLPKIGARWTLVTGFGLSALVAGTAWYLFAEKGLLFDVTFPLGSSFLVFSALSFSNYLREERQKKWVRDAFTHYLAPSIVDQLARQPERLNLGGELREMTLLFSDIRGFTGIAEQFDAAGLTAFMNRYLTPMTDAILGGGGTVDKYVGDAIMAFWNAPLEDPAHAANGCRAALEMLDRLAVLNAELAAEAAKAGKDPIAISIGIGLNSAECCVGNMGSAQRFDYSVLGDGVNLAARLEGQTKIYGVPILVGEETRRLAPEFAALEIDLVQVKGKTAPARIFTLLGGPEFANTDAFRALAKAQSVFLDHYRRQEWDCAQSALDVLRGEGDMKLSALAELYARRIESFRAAPPPPGWNGVYVAETK
jgi:adenylate cyclase